MQFILFLYFFQKNRGEVFEFFSNYDDPYTGFTTPIKVTKVKKYYIDKRNITFYGLISYIILQGKKCLLS